MQVCDNSHFVVKILVFEINDAMGEYFRENSDTRKNCTCGVDFLRRVTFTADRCKL